MKGPTAQAVTSSILAVLSYSEGYFRRAPLANQRSSRASTGHNKPRYEANTVWEVNWCPEEYFSWHKL